MFIFDGKRCAVKTWFHDIPNNLTQATVYQYDNEDDLNNHVNEVSSDIHRFEYSETLHSLVGIEAAVMDDLTAQAEQPPQGE